MMTAFLSRIALEDFDLETSNVSLLNERTLLIKKWNWDYTLAHKFQRHCLKALEESQARVLICCNHPRVLTNGRGLQKPRKGETLNLVDFDPSSFRTLPYPLHQIERGGGLTFHHPGQFIFYPIVRLNPHSLSLSRMMNDIFTASIESLKEWGVEDLTHEHKLLGLWWNNKKLASLGIAIEKLTTFHGMALNMYQDKEMKKALSLLNPCGLTSDIYISVDEIINLENKNLDQFSDLFIKRISHAWQ